MTSIGPGHFERASVILGLRRKVGDKSQAGIRYLWEARLIDITHDSNGVKDAKLPSRLVWSQSNLRRDYKALRQFSTIKASRCTRGQDPFRNTCKERHLAEESKTART